MRAMQVHGDQYDYSKVDYISSSQKVCIICKKHGEEFWQAPNSHLMGHGCPLCAIEFKAEKRRFTNDEYIARCREVWGEKYELGKINYVGRQVKVVVGCRAHGDFLANPDNFLQGKGCPKCKSDNAKRLIYNIGINDSYGESKTKIYALWRDILTRCYDKNALERHPTYKGCELCDDWKYFSNFKKWAEENYKDGYEIEKDIIKKNNKIYGPDTCCFVPRRINILLTRRQRFRGVLPIGVTLSDSGRRYKASLDVDGKTTLVGYYGTAEEAFAAYKAAKESYIRKVAEDYYKAGRIDERVYDALISYEVEMTD